MTQLELDIQEACSDELEEVDTDFDLFEFSDKFITRCIDDNEGFS